MKIITRAPSFSGSRVVDAAMKLAAIDHTHRVGSQRRWSVVLTGDEEVKLCRADYRPGAWERIIGVVTPS